MVQAIKLTTLNSVMKNPGKIITIRGNLGKILKIQPSALKMLLLIRRNPKKS